MLILTGRGGGREASDTSIETIRGVYAGTEALILVPTQPLFASLIDSPMEKKKKEEHSLVGPLCYQPPLLKLFLYYTSCRIISLTHKGIH